MPKITKTPTMAFKAGQGAIWNNVIIHAAAKNKEIIALLRSLVQKIYLYFTINSLVRFAHSIRLFGEIFIYFFHSFATAGNNFFIFFHRGNNTPVVLDNFHATNNHSLLKFTT